MTAPCKSKTKPASAVEPTLRHVWLAWLGLFVAARRESLAAVQRVADRVETTGERVREAAQRAEAGMRDGIDGMCGQVETKVQKFSSEVETRLAPIVEKLGLKKPRRAVRNKQAAKKGARRNTRKVAKRARA